MQNFLTLEGGYLVMGFIVLLITLFVTTRPFMSKTALRTGMISVILVLSFFIGSHFYVTTSRMADVRTAFEADEVVICESRMQRKVAQTVIIQKSNNWFLEEDEFTSPNYTRAFHSARCIVK